MKEALDQQPLPWPFMATCAAFLLYGLWPALKPEHFRQACIRNVHRHWLVKFILPAGVIRVFAVIWVLLCWFALLVGIAARL
jgi:hypothetical protein